MVSFGPHILSSFPLATKQSLVVYHYLKLKQESPLCQLNNHRNKCLHIVDRSYNSSNLKKGVVAKKEK